MGKILLAAAMVVGVAVLAPRPAEAAAVCRPHYTGATVCYDLGTGAVTFTPATYCHPAGGGTLVDLATGANLGAC